MPEKKKKSEHVEITYGNQITVNRGNYENERPLWSIKKVFENDPEHPLGAEEEFRKLQAVVDRLAQQHYDTHRIDMAGVRIRVKDGKSYPSVTSILKPGKIEFPNIEQYAARGKEVHRLIRHFAEEGVWPEPTADCSPLKYTDIPYQVFFEQFGTRIELIPTNFEIECFNDEHLFSGEIDAIGFVDGIKTLIDFKTGDWAWTQLVAYLNSDIQVSDGDIQQLAVFDLKKLKLEILPLTKQSFIQSHWEKFLVKRGEFKSRYGR